MRHRMWHKCWENCLFLSIPWRTFVLGLYFCAEFNKHSKCLRSGIRRVDKETRGQVNALHGLSGAWLGSKHASWWSEDPEVELLGVRWPAHSFTGSLRLGTETSGVLESRGRAWHLFKPWEKTRRRQRKSGDAPAAVTIADALLDTKEFKGWKDVNAVCKACGAIDFYEPLSKRLSANATETAARRHFPSFLLAGYVMWSGCIVMTVRLPGDTLWGTTGSSHVGSGIFSC